MCSRNIGGRLIHRIGAVHHRKSRVVVGAERHIGPHAPEIGMGLRLPRTDDAAAEDAIAISVGRPRPNLATASSIDASA
jgi:hypothetical protein